MDYKTVILMFLGLHVVRSGTLIRKIVVFEKIAEITTTSSKWSVAIQIDLDPTKTLCVS